MSIVCPEASSRTRRKSFCRPGRVRRRRTRRRGGGGGSLCGHVKLPIVEAGWAILDVTSTRKEKTRSFLGICEPIAHCDHCRKESEQIVQHEAKPLALEQSSASAPCIWYVVCRSADRSAGGIRSCLLTTGSSGERPESHFGRPSCSHATRLKQNRGDQDELQQNGAQQVSMERKQNGSLPLALGGDLPVLPVSLFSAAFAPTSGNTSQAGSPMSSFVEIWVCFKLEIGCV